MKNSSKIEETRRKLLKELVEIGPFIEGSLSVVYRTCGTKSCACQRGEKHPAMFFTWKENKVTRSLYVPVAKHDFARHCQANFKKVKMIIKQLSDLQKDLLKL